MDEPNAPHAPGCIGAPDHRGSTCIVDRPPWPANGSIGAQLPTPCVCLGTGWPHPPSSARCTAAPAAREGGGAHRAGEAPAQEGGGVWQHTWLGRAATGRAAYLHAEREIDAACDEVITSTCRFCGEPFGRDHEC